MGTGGIDPNNKQNRREHSPSGGGRINRRMGTDKNPRTQSPTGSGMGDIEDLGALLDGRPPEKTVYRRNGPDGNTSIGELAGLLGEDAPAGFQPAPGAQGRAGRPAGGGRGGVWAEGDAEAKPKKNKRRAENPKKDKPEKKRRSRKGGGDGEPKKKGWLRRHLTPKRVILTLVGLFVFAVFFAGFFFVYTTRNDDLWLDLETIPYKTETVLYYTDQNGQRGTFAVIPCTQHKEYVDGSQIPDTLRHAFVAIEDRKFYTHHGFDFNRTVFAVANELWHRVTGSYIGGEDGRKQGASTITQQLIKNLTRDDEDSNMSGYMRKLRELCRGIRLDALYSKDEILDAYMNTISFTGNTAGVQAEAKKLFGKTVDQLTTAECASLAAITNSPYRFSPVQNPENHLERRDYVLYQMHDQGYITQGEYDAAVAEPLNLNYQGEPTLPKYVTSYFTDMVINDVITELASQYNLSRREGSNLFYNGGLRIYTTVDPTLQRAMEDVMVNRTYHPSGVTTVTKQLTDEDGQPMVDGDDNPVMGPVEVRTQGAMISLDYDGGVAAVVGGLGEKTVSRGFNRATDALRQVGSTMKPIGPYVTALQDGWITWSSAFPDEPALVLKNEETGEETDWPRNFSNTYEERDILVREGVARSLNTTAVWVGRQSGNRRMYTFLHDDLGIHSLVRDDVAPGPLTLGATTYGISPMDMAAAYAMFGNGGYDVTAHSFTHIENGRGGEILAFYAPKKRVIDEDTAFIMNKLLGEVMANGTAAGYAVPGNMPSVGKTGTTNDNRDHWFIGLTPYYVTASWYGYDDNMTLEVDRSNHPPTLAWRAAMSAAQASLPAKSFPECDSVAQHDYCTTSGTAAGPGCPSAKGWYKWYQPPTGKCPVHG